MDYFTIQGGEAFYAPAAYSLMAKFHHRTRALAMSLHQGALYIGVMTSGFLGGWIAERWGWRSAFYVFGGCGILLGIIFIFRLKDAPEPSATEPAPHPPIGREMVEALGVLFRVPTAMMLLTGFMAIVFVNNAFVVWAPEFLREKQDLSLTLAGGYSMFWHHLPALIGVSIGGPLSDRWVLKRNTARLELQAVAMALGVPSIVLMGLAPNLVIACVGLAAFGFFRGLYESNTHAALFDVIAPNRRGSAVAVMVMIAFLLGSTSPWLLGRCRETFGTAHGLSYGFAGLSLAYLIGALAVTAARFFFFHRDRIHEASVT